MSRRRHAKDFFAIMDQEEYVWAMKTSANEQKIQDEKDKDEDQDSVVFTKQKSSFALTDKNKTKLLASFVPDEIILNMNDYNSRTFECSLICGDVSGFTELCETYSQIGSGGPSRLTNTLSNFIGAMVQEIMSHGGDIIKFSGDAFLAIWKLVQGATLRDCIQEAIDCALVIQKTHNNYVTDVGVTLRVKLGISSGAITFSLVGDSQLSNYIEVGEPILDTKDILEVCRAGDIIISEKSYAYIDSSAYLSERHSSGKFIQIFGVGPTWRQVQKFMNHSASDLRQTQSRTRDIDSSSSTQSLYKRTQSAEFALRPMVNVAVHSAKDLYENLKRFIISPVMQRIELDEPLEYLTELRHITVLMINIVPHAVPFDDIIELVKKIYNIMSVHIHSIGGCINKVSCFDKDLMCVVIFGLRGLKKNLECRNALRGASLIYEDISHLAHVKSLSIGVSTGMVYCGVFGHTLRREYTVIGLTVNKAARLMVAYPGKVTCCSDTFINCKMREAHFEPQTYVYLKGIKNPGPVYEFKNSEVEGDKMLVTHTYPMLGNQAELKQYTTAMNAFLKSIKDGGKSGTEDQIKMLMVEGETKSGKTRLLEEMMFVTPSEVTIQTVRAEYASHTSYGVLKKIFYSAMGIAKKSPNHIKQETIHFLLTGSPDLDVVCALNAVFDVNYPVSAQYKNYSPIQQIAALGRLLQYLASVVIKSPKLVMIERMVVMDDVCWQVIPFLLNVETLFVVGSMRPHKEATNPSRNWIHTLKMVKLMKLEPIESVYFGGLACQMIKVEAIPPELEHALHARSAGNAGWIKNFVLCLQQAEAIVVKSMNYKEIYEHGLSMAPLYMLKRLTADQIDTWRKVLEEKPMTKDVIDDWFVYVGTCRDEATDVGKREELMKLFNWDQQVKACIKAPGFEAFVNLSEPTREIQLIRTFDHLLYTEQLVAKCGSVLGWQFPRSMLEYVMGDSCSKRSTAEAIQKLFEIRIFSCSQGDFTEAGEYVLIRNRVKANYETQPIVCNCLGLNIPETCEDLPKYASCGYLHFTSNHFLEATYNLLPEAQKTEFHQRAGRYLEKNTRKCRACGNGFFEEFTGRSEKPMKPMRKLFKTSLMSHSLSYDEDYQRSYRSVQSDTESQSIIGGSVAQSVDVMSGDYSAGVDTQYYETLGLMYPKKLVQLKERASLTRTFSLYDFASCECKPILNHMYGAITRHYKYGGQYNEMLKAMLAYSKSCINLGNTAEAFITLREAEKYLESKVKVANEALWKRYVLQGKIYTLRASALIGTNQLEEAKKYLFRAMKKYGAPFPESNFGRYIKNYSLKLKQKLALYCFPDTLTKQLKRYEAVYFNDVAECLYSLNLLFHETRQYKQVELAGVWALHCALKADYEFKTICQCFTAMIFIALGNYNSFHCLALEVHSLRFCHKKIHNIESDDLKYVAELYQAIRRVRTLRSELQKSIYIGYISLRLAISVNHNQLIRSVLPALILTLTLKSYLTEACSLLNELNYYSNESDSNSLQTGRLSFYIACLRFHMETGYTVVPYQECEKYNYAENLQLAALNKPDSRIEFMSLMWLWNCRNCYWEYTPKWAEGMDKYVDQLLQAQDSGPYSTMYILECYLLTLVHSKNSQSITTHKRLEETIQKIIKKLQPYSKFSQLVRPRLLHFQAYYEYIDGNVEKALKILENSSVSAAKCENGLELVHINHSKMNWTNQLPNALKDKWVAHCDPDQLLDYHLLEEFENKILSFTLPTPIYD